MHIVTTSGATVSLLNPAPEHISLTDIAHALALLSRWGGATEAPLSIAQHSVMVAEQLPHEYRAYGLLHDAYTAYLGALTAPARSALASLGAGDAYQRMVTALSKAIHVRAGLEWPIPQAIAQAITLADARAKATEIRDLLPLGSLLIEANPLRQRIRPMAWPAAEAAYLQALTTHIPTMRRAA